MSEKIVQLNEEVIKGQLKENLTQAARYEHSEARQGYRSDHYDRNLIAASRDVKLHVPRPQGHLF